MHIIFIDIFCTKNVIVATAWFYYSILLKRINMSVKLL